MTEHTPQFAVQRIYLKDLSFESPQTLQILQQAAKPKIHQEISTGTTRLDNDLHEIVLTVTIKAETDDKTIFIAEVQQAGLFHLVGFADDDLRHVIGAVCPNILFPYAREVVDNVVVKGGFPPLMLPPINFDALYQHALAQMAEKQNASQH